MAEEEGYSIEIVDRTRISLPQNYAPTSTVQLSFLDLPWLHCCPMQRLFLYDLSQNYSVLRFTDTVLPSIKRSLSAALQRFYPLAGVLNCPPPPEKPLIICSNGDSVHFTAAVSEADFDDLTSDRPQAALLLHPLLPPLPPPHRGKDGTRVAPLLAVQVTLFQNSGICIGVQFNHVAADGKAFNHFMKTWASVCRAEVEGDTTCIEKSLPVLDRSVIKDPDGLEPILLKNWLDVVSTLDENSPSPSLYAADKLRAAFTLSRARVERLKNGIMSQIQEPLRISTFVATCALTWACLIKSKEIRETEASTPDVHHFYFAADCRDRLGYPIPATYFGNCLDICTVALKREELVGRDGILSAARVIGAKVKELEEDGGPLRAPARWSSYRQGMETGHIVIVAGSPRLRVYDTDFGWGRPKRSRVVHVDGSAIFSFAESRDEEGGVEIGLALDKVSMDIFCVIFEQGLSSLCN